MKDNGRTWASKEGLYNTKSWRKLRNFVLENEPLCRMCKSMGEYTPASMVDHKIPITKDNVETFLQIDNLQPLCEDCHNFKTQRDKVKKKTNYRDINEILDL